MVESVGFVFPFSMVLINPRLTLKFRAISPCDILFLVLIRFRFNPSFADSFFIIPSISLVIVYHNVMIYRNSPRPTAHSEKKKSRAKQIKHEKAVGRGRYGTAEAEEHAFQRVLERRLWRGGIPVVEQAHYGTGSFVRVTTYIFWK